MSKSVNPQIKVVNGFKLPVHFSEERFLAALNYKSRDDDVFLVTYARSGTTWTKQLISLIMSNGEPVKDTIEFHMLGPFFEMVGPEEIYKMKRPGLIKTHLTGNLIPYSPSAKYVYVARNPKDCLTSLYYFMNSNTSSEHIEFNDVFEWFINGEMPFGDHLNHVLSWYLRRNEPNILFLTYEEVKKDTRAAVIKLGKFLGGEFSKNVENEETIKKILEYSTVDFLKELYNKWPEDPAALENLPEGVKEVMKKRRSTKPRQFIRKGIIGDWHHLLSEEQSRRIDEKLKEISKGNGLMDIWKDDL